MSFPKRASPDPNKVRAGCDFPRPTNLKELRSFLGLSNCYRKFILNFAKITATLNELTRKVNLSYGLPHASMPSYTLKKR